MSHFEFQEFSFSKGGKVQYLSCENELYLDENKKIFFYVSGFVLSLALKQRLKATRKWPKSCDKTKQLHNKGVQLWDTNIGLGHQYGNRDVM